MKPEDAKRIREITACHGPDLCGTNGTCHACFLLRVIEERGKEVERLVGALVDADRACDDAMPADHRCAKEGCNPCSRVSLTPQADKVGGIVTPIPESDVERLRRGPKTWTRFRFEVPCEDCRPVKFPPPGPWWETGTGFNGSTVVAFMPGPPKEARKLVMKFWPDACRFSSEDECPEGPTYSSRFTKPSWWKGA